MPAIDELGLSREQQRKAKAIMDVAPGVLARALSPDRCVAATRILLDVLHRLHVRASPLSVKVSIYNGAMCERVRALGRRPQTFEEVLAWREAGAWEVVVGESDGPPGPGRWAGHLIALAWGKVIFDLTLPQANRPQKGISLPPALLPVGSAFVAGESPAGFDCKGCNIVYQACPADRSYERGGDWRNHDGRLGQHVRRILADVRDLLKG